MITEADFVGDQAASLAGILRHYLRTPRPVSNSEPFALTMAELLAKPLQPRWMDRLDELARDPVRAVLRPAAREIGWRVYAAGGVELMTRVSDRVEDLEPTLAAGAVLDKWWDGIGAGQPTGCTGNVWVA